MENGAEVEVALPDRGVDLDMDGVAQPVTGADVTPPGRGADVDRVARRQEEE